MIDIPDVRQECDDDCGPACVAAILRWFGRKASVAVLREQLCTSPIDGTEPRSIESWLRREGFRVLAGEMSLSDLREQTAKDRPVICLVHNHYVIVTSLARGKVRYHDPERDEGGPSERPVASFMDWWYCPDRLGVSYLQFGLSVWRE